LLAAIPYTAGVLWLAKVAAAQLQVPQAEETQESPGR
jgi:hypothetical protein